MLAEIPEPKRASSLVNLDIEDLPTARALGLKWNVEADKFVWEVLAKVQRLLEEKPMARLGVLSFVSSLFNPLGFIAPFILKAKPSVQDLCRKILGWNNVIDEQESVQWLAGWKTYQNYKCFKLKDVLNRRTLAKPRVFSCTFYQMDHM